MEYINARQARQLMEDRIKCARGQAKKAIEIEIRVYADRGYTNNKNHECYNLTFLNKEDRREIKLFFESLGYKKVKIKQHTFSLSWEEK